MLQQPDKITILYAFDHAVRHVRINQPHPARVTPSWSGDSVGHYEGGTLVIDIVGVKVGPFAMHCRIHAGRARSDHEHVGIEMHGLGHGDYTGSGLPRVS
jgi:hypothetical protein